jgi:hypothetical protein
MLSKYEQVRTLKLPAFYRDASFTPLGAAAIPAIIAKGNGQTLALGCANNMQFGRGGKDTPFFTPHDRLPNILYCRNSLLGRIRRIFLYRIQISNLISRSAIECPFKCEFASTWHTNFVPYRERLPQDFIWL